MGVLWGLKDQFAIINNLRGIVEYDCYMLYVALCKGNIEW